MRNRPTDLPASQRLTWKHLRAMLSWLRFYPGRTVAALALLLAAKVATVGVPLVLKALVDGLEATASGDPPTTWLLFPLGLVLAYGFARLTAGAFTELRDTLFARVRYGILRRISVQVLEHLHRLSLRYHLERRTGGIHRDVTRGSQSLSSLLNTVVFNLLPTVVELALVAGILLAVYRPVYALIVVAATLLYGALTFAMTEWRIRYRVEMNQRDASASAVAIDSLMNFETVQLFHNQEHELHRYNEELNAWEDAAVRSQSTLTLLNLAQSSVIAIGLTALLAIGAQDVLRGEITLGDFVAIHAFLLQLFIPLGFLGTLYSMFKHALSDMERMFHLLDTPPEIVDRENAQPLPPGDGAIVIEGLHFHYDPERPILQGIDLVLQPGERIALVGESGSGKSTLVRLLFRLYDPIEGRILLDGQDLRDTRLRDIRQAISMVPQDPVLFHETLRYNILYGRLDATEEELRRAVERAQLADFVERLPKGLDTVVGERGLKLSGGEKQRVAIARAILKEPRVFVFDEATSSLDSIAENAITEAMRNAARDATTLVIAHRLSTVVDADRILVLAQGQVVESGTHDALLKAQGVYARLWHRQQESSPPLLDSASGTHAGGSADPGDPT